MERSYVMIKPGFTQYEKEIVERLHSIGAKVTNKKTMKLTDEIVDKHYAEHKEKEFYPNLKSYILSGEVIGMIVERQQENLIADIRKIVGATKNPEAGTIRHDFGIGEVTRNVIHASDSIESANREIGIFFPEYK